MRRSHRAGQRDMGTDGYSGRAVLPPGQHHSADSALALSPSIGLRGSAPSPFHFKFQTPPTCFLLLSPAATRRGSAPPRSGRGIQAARRRGGGGGGAGDDGVPLRLLPRVRRRRRCEGRRRPQHVPGPRDDDDDDDPTGWSACAVIAESTAPSSPWMRSWICVSLARNVSRGWLTMPACVCVCVRSSGWYGQEDQATVEERALRRVSARRCPTTFFVGSICRFVLSFAHS
jgi:hypothetical protein